MYPISPQLNKILLAFLFLLPAFSLYIKIIWPHLAQTGFDGTAIICFELIFILFIAVFGKHPKNISRNSYFLIVALASWHVLGVISALLSDHFYASIIKQIEYAIHCLFAYSAWVFLSQTGKTEKMSFWLIFTSMWTVYYILSAWHSHPDAFHHNWVNGTPMFNNIRHLGYLQIGILPLLFLPLLINKPHKHLTTLLLLTVFWASIIWSCSRGTFLTAVILTAVLATFFSHKGRAIISLSIIAFFLGWLIAIQFPSESPSLDTLRLLFLNFNDAQSLDVNQLSSNRIDIWKLTLINMWQHNALLGFGADGFRYITPLLVPNIVQPHNSPIQFLSEFGLIGFSVLLGVVFFILKLWSENPGTTVNKLARFCLLAIGIGSLLDGHFHHTFSLLLIACLTALSFAKSSYSSQGSSNTLSAFFLLALSVAFIWPMQKHWQTYIAQQSPLINEFQLKEVESFPSYYSPMIWLYGFNFSSELRLQAIKFGQLNGPKQCNYYLIEYSESQEIETQNALLIPIRQICSKAELNNTNNPEFIKLALEVSQ